MLKYLIATIVSLSLVCGNLPPEDDAKSKRLERWVEYYKEVAKGYDIRVKSAPDQPLDVTAEPILVYSNPTIGFDTHGALFVWTNHGRAEAIGAIWSKQIGPDVKSLKNVNHEFHSLAAEPLVATGRDGVKWTPEKPGLEFKLVPNASIPAASRGRRLAQMREISRQFTGFDLNPREGGSEEVERQMRVLPAPLYRYAEAAAPADPDAIKKRQSLTDGAIFGLFYDWDPEILLVIETQQTVDGPRWYYGVAYLDYKPLRLQCKKQDVWEKPEKNFGSANSKYFCVIGVTQRPPNLSDDTP